MDEAVKGTTIAAKNDISIASGKDINIKGSNVASEAGKADLAAENNINIANATEYHERLHEEHNKVSGLLSSKTTDIYDYSKQNAVVGSNVSAGEIAISSKKDTNITGSNVVADNDVNVKTGGNLNIGSAEQTGESEYIKSVKKRPRLRHYSEFCVVVVDERIQHILAGNQQAVALPFVGIAAFEGFLCPL